MALESMDAHEQSILKYVAITAVLVVSLFIAFGVDTADADRSAASELSDDVEAFSSAAEFRAYMEQASRSQSYTSLVGARDAVETISPQLSTQPEMTQGQDTAGGDGGASTPTPDRYSETNVQEQGIDEPDIVKTDGQSIFYSRGNYYTQNTTILDAFPAANLSISSSLKTGGELLLANDELVVLGDQEIRGVDVADPASPSQDWKADVNGSIHTARLYNGRLYVVTRKDVDYDMPCPIRPMTGVDSVTIPCTRIYHPPNPSDAETTYNVMVMDPATGAVDDAVSFVGSYQNTVVYVSGENLYLTYRNQVNRADVMMEFLTTEMDDLLSQNALNRLQRLQTYDISDQARQVEVQAILQDWRQSLSKDRRLQVENELSNRLSNYSKAHMRDHQRTGIVRIGLESMDVEAEGSVPGELLNQFSLDEYQDTLRVATTVEGVVAPVESENDVYTIASDDLEIQGSVEGMGLNERIYSVRFIEDKGYVVTFRRIDPFHVLDLSDPSSPSLQGELKLPGFSSYLHPLDEDRILGIGEEQGNVKAVIFDVSDPANPETDATYRLDEYWTEVNNNHHAFLIDRKHAVFFLPGGKGGYIFSYDDGLELVRAVDVSGVDRAVYINDYLYILATNKVVVLDETDWSKVAELELPELPNRNIPIEPFPMPRIR